MTGVFFGLGRKFDDGTMPSVGLSRFGRVLEVHASPVGYKLWYRVGRLSQATINWGPSRHFDNGTTPRVALNGRDFAVEVHKNQLGNSLYYRYGSITGALADEVSWGTSRSYDTGVNPAVAMNDAGLVVAVHKSQSNSGLWYRLGQVKGTGANRRVEWIEGAKGRYDEGATPVVAVNNDGIIVEVHKSPSAGRTLWWQTFTVEGNKLRRHRKGHFTALWRQPSVAITDDGLVIVTATAPYGNSVSQITGQLNEKLEIIQSGKGVQYDDGTDSTVAAAGRMAVEIHEGRILQTLWFSTSIITDRASWMQNRLNTLGRKPLRDLVLPASHDAAMYKGGFSAFGKTQDLSIYGQLRYGIRYFDLRPWWYFLPKHHWVIGHGDIIGPSLQTVLNDVRKFAEEGHQELVILKLSHFRNTDRGSYEILQRMVQRTIGPWLVESTPGDRRLADVTLREYVAGRKGPAILVVVDGEWAVSPRTPGFWVYRDWDAPMPVGGDQGDLRVFDRFTNTESFKKMRKDQLQKFENYTGTMAKAPKEQCDLFLLSWTLTPKYQPPWMVWPLAKDANPELGQDIRLGFPPAQIPNEQGKIINLLYVDYVEFARVTDVALFQNGEHTPEPVEIRPVRLPIVRPIRPIR